MCYFRIRTVLLQLLSSTAFLSTAFWGSAQAQAADGLIAVKSHHSVQATADKLEHALNAKGMTVFKRINDPQYLKERHGIEGEKCDGVITMIEGALGNFAKAATVK